MTREEAMKALAISIDQEYANKEQQMDDLMQPQGRSPVEALRLADALEREVWDYGDHKKAARMWATLRAAAEVGRRAK